MTQNKIHYGNSTPEQKKYIENKIEQEILCLNNIDIEFILKIDDFDAPFSWDDFENLYERYCPECGRDYEIDNENTDTCEHCESNEAEPQEIMQHFYVTNWLAKKLRDIGEPVIIREGQPGIWGRTCCGQCVSLDPTFWEIFQDGVQNII